MAPPVKYCVRNLAGLQYIALNRNEPMSEDGAKPSKTKRQWHYSVPFATAVEKTAALHNMRDFGAVLETVADKPQSDVAKTFHKIRTSQGLK